MMYKNTHLAKKSMEQNSDVKKTLTAKNYYYFKCKKYIKMLN